MKPIFLEGAFQSFIIMSMKTKDFENLSIRPIAHIQTDFPTKFGIPRQSELIKELKGKIVFEKEFRKEGILKGLEDFSHLWIIWGFSSFNEEKEFSPTIRPPRLGGNKSIGVFASRSPNRPNPLGLSVVKIERIETHSNEGPVLYVLGADMLDNTPIYDIKPYIPLFDSISDAKEGYAKETKEKHLEVFIPEEYHSRIEESKFNALREILAEDPRPGYHHNEKRSYGFFFSDMEIHFHVEEETRIIVEKIDFQKR